MRTALIIGANRGIGLELARTYRGLDYHVMATCRAPSEALEALDIQVIEGVDVGRSECGDRLRQAIGDAPVDLLVHNAGLLRPDALANLDYQSVRLQFEINALGPLRVVEALVPNMAGGGRIALITSRMGSIEDNTSGGMYGYRMSKAALNMAGKSLSLDLSNRGIAVVTLHPGFVKTDMTGGQGLIEAPESAALLVQRIEELTLDDTGRFLHASGEVLPW